MALPRPPQSSRSCTLWIPGSAAPRSTAPAAILRETARDTGPVKPSRKPRPPWKARMNRSTSYCARHPGAGTPGNFTKNGFLCLGGAEISAPPGTQAGQGPRDWQPKTCPEGTFLPASTRGPQEGLGLLCCAGQTGMAHPQIRQRQGEVPRFRLLLQPWCRGARGNACDRDRPPQAWDDDGVHPTFGEAGAVAGVVADIPPTGGLALRVPTALQPPRGTKAAGRHPGDAQQSPSHLRFPRRLAASLRAPGTARWHSALPGKSHRSHKNLS